MDIRPLMVFAGPNNSGKSYVASLLWGLVAMPGDLEPPPGPDLAAAEAWMAQRLGDGRAPVTCELTAEDVARFDDLFDTTVAANRSKLVQEIFSEQNMDLRSLSFRNLSTGRNPSFRWTGPGLVANDSMLVVRGVGSHGGSEWVFRIPANDPATIRSRALRFLLYMVPCDALATSGTITQEEFRPYDPIYIPASRTGFMQLYQAAARRSTIEAFRPGANPGRWLDLTKPTFRFLDMLAFGLKDDEGRRSGDEADLLEQAMTGRIELVPSAVNEYRYHPTGAPSPLPMKLSSALVTELAPLVLVLRRLSHFPVLILEEPEAHLHPELQRRMAQVIVRLVRKGLFVWVTTHSENFCQQLNNFLKIGALPSDKRAEAQGKLGYGSQDYLELDDISGYEFRLDPSRERSSVVEMKRTTAGLVMPTFNTTLVELAKEIDYLDDLLAM
ncbi:AAA family ATPase [Sorangium sp. So ce1389]|uniref:AAA family ATPase n=1 Tax=Sorangium sp. So ce1389 TaxID=3133336 RepID=UPI003F5E9D34